MMWIFLTILNSFGQNCPTCCGMLPQREPMQFTFYQDTGRFVGGTGQFAVNTFGYSGNNTDGVDGRNNPQAQCVPNIGPAPTNAYILDKCNDTMHSGTVIRPCAFPLIPQDEKRMCGRYGIWIHGCNCCSSEYPDCDNTAPPCGTCSEGCIVIERSARENLRTGDLLIVESNDPQQIYPE